MSFSSDRIKIQLPTVPFGEGDCVLALQASEAVPAKVLRVVDQQVVMETSNGELQDHYSNVVADNIPNRRYWMNIESQTYLERLSWL